ncbi:MAG: hypothetical protein KC656_08530, partial [Myxococcales bacterium]|nr:hypothetical protein [Myxococcales bacterium]
MTGVAEAAATFPVWAIWAPLALAVVPAMLASLVTVLAVGRVAPRPGPLPEHWTETARRSWA